MKFFVDVSDIFYFFSSAEGKGDQSRFLGRGCDKALFSEKKGFSVKRGGGNSVNQGFPDYSSNLCPPKI